jgi:hypothetical protein
MARLRSIFAPSVAAKWRASEREIQASVLEHWLTLGVPNSLVAAIPNAFAHGQAGLTKGLADLLVLAPGLPVGFIELKRDRKSPRSDAQIEFGRLCDKLGVRYAVAVGRDEPIQVLKHWGAVKRAAA